MDAYDKDHLPQPVNEMRTFRKTVLTRMWHVELTAPTAVYTLSGRVELPAGWKGYIAVDQAGYPYPIDREEQAKTFEEVFED